jgi:hypothetical protein
VVAECDVRHGKIECILFFIDPVLGRVRLLAEPAGRNVATAWQQHSVGKPNPFPGSIDVYFMIRRVRVYHHRLSAGREHRHNEGSSGHFRFVAEGRGARRETRRDNDQRSADG